MNGIEIKSDRNGDPKCWNYIAHRLSHIIILVLAFQFKKTEFIFLFVTLFCWTSKESYGTSSLSTAFFLSHSVFVPRNYICGCYKRQNTFHRIFSLNFFSYVVPECFGVGQFDQKFLFSLFLKHINLPQAYINRYIINPTYKHISF